MKRRFVTLDVFTTRRHAGNPLAAVLRSERLDTEAMQAVAKEFNLSETVVSARIGGSAIVVGEGVLL